MTGGLGVAIGRGLSYAPYADLIWCETSEPNLDEARQFAEAIHDRFPGKLLAYNCSPSFNWKAKLDDATIARFQRELGAMGYKFQFITLAGFHVLNLSMFDLARAYRDAGMAAYAKVQQAEFAREAEGGLSRRQAPAVRRHRLLRPGRPVRRRRQVLDHGPAPARPRRSSSSTCAAAHWRNRLAIEFGLLRIFPPAAAVATVRSLGREPQEESSLLGAGKGFCCRVSGSGLTPQATNCRSFGA